MDDTALGRPPRHERTATRSAPRTTPAMEVDGESRRECSSCGAEVVLRLDGKLPPFIREIAERRLHGDAPVLCDDCTALSDARARAEEEAERRELVLSERRRRSGIPPKWEAQTFELLEDDSPRVRALMRAREWAAGDVGGLVLWGPVGRGKTAIAAAAANARMAVSGVRWLSVASLLMDLSHSFGSPEHARALRALEAAGSESALVLDDLDKGKPNEHQTQPLYVAVNGWIEAGLPLLVTLNRNLDDLERWLPESFGEAISSRLSGYCKVQQVGGVDRRLT